MFTLQEALEVIKDKPEFRVSQKDSYTVIDYVVQGKDSFKGEDARQTVILQNLRGTAFNNQTGEIISLPFHKFHNLGECQGYMPEDIDFSKKESVMLKLDGSMIRVIPVGEGGWVFGTRAGETDVSKMVEDWFVGIADENTELELHESLCEFIDLALSKGFSPIFEFTSRLNKVVIDYPTPTLTLLAIRENETGEYATMDQMVCLANLYKIPVVKTFDDFTPENVKKWKDAEGVVVSFPNGFRVKIKADDYVTKHGVKDLIKFEKDVIKMCLDGSLDDVLPLLDKEEKERVQNYSESLLEALSKVESKQALYVLSNAMDYSQPLVTKKEFAALIKGRVDSKYLFQIFDDKENTLKDDLIGCCGSGPKVENFLNNFNLPRWKDA